MDPKPPSEPTYPITSPKHQITAQSSIKDEAINSRRSSDVSSPVSDSTHESTCRSLSPKQSPPIQVMERPEDFDFSNRFSSSSSSSEWSSVSDESLFSIHFTNSYTHDQAHLPEHSNQSDVGSLKVVSLKVESLNNLDEPQKVVRWKTQVERLADEGVNSEGQRLESSPLTDHKSSEQKYEASLLCVAEISFVGQHATVGLVTCQSGHVGTVAEKK
ncbi:hypothetical protein L1987_12015 [Smallanthus sonchifolius]|uniref:Uncharacterized protein n=1 Tax=Smallanthus sonchifolius TaxID=185202 RepID=A0ACB9JCY5_9ASTR|nr:hypothetical protein L1987_12015 [Smallanthus sonchifolius]